MKKIINEYIDIIIVAGGFGNRIHGLSKKYGCKSLIPLNGSPCIQYLISSIRSVLPNSRIILCLDTREIIDKFKQIIFTEKMKSIIIYHDKHRGPVQTIYEAASICNTRRVLVFFGNQIVTQDHIRKIMSFKNNSVVLSTFSKISECHSKIGEIDKNSNIIFVSRYDKVKKLLENERYIDVPYCLPIEFFSMETFPTLKRLFVKSPMNKTKLIEDEQVFFVDIDSTPEFHFVEEIKKLEKFVENSLDQEKQGR